MSPSFLKVLNISITAGWLVLAVVMLRLVLKKAPKWVHCLLWGLVALRLVLPFTIESRLSLLPSAEPVRREAAAVERPADLRTASVPYERVTDMRHMGSYLVGTSRYKLNLHKAFTIAGFYHLVFCDNVFTAVYTAVKNLYGIVSAVLS